MCFCFCFSVGYLSISRAKKQVKESDKKSYFLTFISNIYFYLQPEETLENTGTALGASGLCLEHKSKALEIRLLTSCLMSSGTAFLAPLTLAAHLMETTRMWKSVLLEGLDPIKDPNMELQVKSVVQESRKWKKMEEQAIVDQGNCTEEELREQHEILCRLQQYRPCGSDGATNAEGIVVTAAAAYSTDNE